MSFAQDQEFWFWFIMSQECNHIICQNGRFSITTWELGNKTYMGSSCLIRKCFKFCASSSLRNIFFEGSLTICRKEFFFKKKQFLKKNLYLHKTQSLSLVEITLVKTLLRKEIHADLSIRKRSSTQRFTSF